jgi:hypothetical protein
VFELEIQDLGQNLIVLLGLALHLLKAPIDADKELVTEVGGNSHLCLLALKDSFDLAHKELHEHVLDF